MHVGECGGSVPIQLELLGVCVHCTWFQLGALIAPWPHQALSWCCWVHSTSHTLDAAADDDLSRHNVWCCCSYITRRAKEEFHALAKNTDAAAAEAAWQRAQSQLGVWQRQSVVYGLYGRRVKNVMVSPWALHLPLLQHAIAVGSTLAAAAPPAPQIAALRVVPPVGQACTFGKAANPGAQLGGSSRQRCGLLAAGFHVHTAMGITHVH